MSKECDTLNCGTNCEGPGLTGTSVPANAAALRIATLLPTPTHAPLGRQCSSPCWQVSPASKHVACDRQLLQHSTYAILLVLTSAPCVFMCSAVCVCVCVCACVRVLCVCVCVCTADCACCSMGNPHATFFAEDCEKVPLDAVGHDLEHHSSLPPHLRSPPRMPAEGAWVGRPLNTCASAPWQSKRRCGAASCAHAAHHGRAFDSLPLSLRSCACCVCVCVGGTVWMAWEQLLPGALQCVSGHGGQRQEVDPHARLGAWHGHHRGVRHRCVRHGCECRPPRLHRQGAGPS